MLFNFRSEKELYFVQPIIDPCEPPPYDIIDTKTLLDNTINNVKFLLEILHDVFPSDVDVIESFCDMFPNVDYDASYVYGNECFSINLEHETVSVHILTSDLIYDIILKTDKCKFTFEFDEDELVFGKIPNESNNRDYSIVTRYNDEYKIYFIRPNVITNSYATEVSICEKNIVRYNVHIAFNNILTTSSKRMFPRTKQILPVVGIDHGGDTSLLTIPHIHNVISSLFWL